MRLPCLFQGQDSFCEDRKPDLKTGRQAVTQRQFIQFRRWKINLIRGI